MFVSYQLSSKIFKVAYIANKKDLSIPKAATRAVLQEKLFLKNFSIFTGKQLCWSLFLIELHACSLVILLKETPTQYHRCFPVNIAKFSRTPILKKIFEQLTLEFQRLTVNISSQGLVSGLKSIVPLEGPLQCLMSSLQVAQSQVPFLFEKREIIRNSYLLSLDITRCTLIYLFIND